MAYSENGGVINTAGNVTAGGFVTKKYLFEAYPQLSDQAKSAGLWGWGKNDNGQLGDGPTAASKSSPVQTLAGGSNWKQHSCGTNNTAAVKTDGTLWVWGSGGQGNIGDNTTSTKYSPVQTIASGTNWQSVSVGGDFVTAIKTDGTLWLWGNNADGQLGTNNTTNYSSPVQTVSAGTNWKYISAGGGCSSAIKTDGTLWLWGQNYYGNLGNGTNGISSYKSSPVQTVSGGTNWRFVSNGGYHVGAIKTDGTLWLWGKNTYGQLGDNATSNRNSPVQTVSAGTSWRQVSCSRQSTAAIKTDGTLWSWGRNNYGQLGNNNTTNQSSPVQTVAAGTNWRQVSVGRLGSMAAIKTDGTLWTWGRNDNGQLGDNTRTGTSSPIQTIAGGNNWKLVSSGNYCVLAIKDFNEDF